MTDQIDPLNGLDLEQAIDLRWTLRDIRARRLKIVTSQPIPLGKAGSDEFDRDA
jgi:hypothetical protein